MSDRGVKKILLVFVGIFLFTSVCKSQRVSCEELISYVEREGEYKGTVSSFQLLNSSWLKEVKAYEIEDVIVVIADIRTNTQSLFSKKYIFCSVPQSNWDNFYWPNQHLGLTYGESFRKYIFEYKCNCN